MKESTTKSFISSIKLIENIIPGFSKNIQSAQRFAEDFYQKHNPRDIPGNLSIDEIAAINLYTQESGFDKMLNEILKDGFDDELKKFHSYLSLFTQALNKLPNYNKAIYRGVKRDLSFQYEKGAKIIWTGFSSCTKDLKLEEQFLGNQGERTLCIIYANAKDIHMLSNFHTEHEVVLLPGTKFIVIGTAKIGDLRMTEIRQENL